MHRTTILSRAMTCRTKCGQVYVSRVDGHSNRECIIGVVRPNPVECSSIHDLDLDSGSWLMNDLQGGDNLPTPPALVHSLGWTLIPFRCLQVIPHDNNSTSSVRFA